MCWRPVLVVNMDAFFFHAPTRQPGSDRLLQGSHRVAEWPTPLEPSLLSCHTPKSVARVYTLHCISWVAQSLHPSPAILTVTPSSPPYSPYHSLIPPLSTTTAGLAPLSLSGRASRASWSQPAQRGPRPEEDWQWKMTRL